MEFHVILKKILRSFNENFIQFLEDFHSTSKRISLNF